MEAVRMILGRTPEATGSQIAKAAMEEFGIEISGKKASAYKSMLKSRRKAARKRAPSPAAPAPAPVAAPVAKARDEQGGVNDLLSAAQKLGWKRVKQIVDQVLQAPA
jgi:hypothetical protein